jgi:hypothetical protein
VLINLNRDTYFRGTEKKEIKLFAYSDIPEEFKIEILTRLLNVRFVPSNLSKNQ